MAAIRTHDDLGTILRARRESLGLTLQQVAAQSDTGRRLLIELEHGNRDVTLGNLLNVIASLGLELRVDDPATSSALPSQTVRVPQMRRDASAQRLSTG